jgi:hypothetical protein
VSALDTSLTLIVVALAMSKSSLLAANLVAGGRMSRNPAKNPDFA